MSAELLRVRGLHAFYGESHILHGVDLSVNAGAVYYAFDRKINLRDVTLDGTRPLYWRRPLTMSRIPLQTVDMPSQ